MTLRHMKIFLQVYQFENITKSAQALHMTQPAVSRAIQELESYYGVRLFERLNHRLYVTEAGKEFYRYAVHIAEMTDQLEKGLKAWDELGTIRIGASVTIGNFLLPRVLLQLKKKHPELKIKATVSNGETLQRALLDNQLDFAAVEGGGLHELLEKRAFHCDHLIPVLPPDSPHRGKGVPMEELLESPLLLRERGSAGRSFLDHVFAVHELPVSPMMESVSTQAIVQAVHTGLGISFLPEQLVKGQVASGFVSTCRLSNEPLRREHYLVWHQQKFLTKTISEAMELFCRCAEEDTADGQ